jgi:FkbM family methyltransferase
MFYTGVGISDTTRGRPTLFGEKNKAGYLLYGPFAAMQPGNYVVTFMLEVGEASTTEVVVCGRADVAIDGGKSVIAETSLYGSRLCGPGPTALSLPFHLDGPAEVEFRIHTSGRFPMWVDPTPSVRVCFGDEAGFCPLFPIGYLPRHEIVTRRLGDIRFLFESGAELSETEEGLVGLFEGVKVLLENVEDMQVFNEVFFAKDYKVECLRKAIFIDIGMNAGMTSLFSAANPDIEHIFAFDPFEGPHRRALRNFALNPSLAEKITPMQVGLGEGDSKLEVVVESSTSIGTSIRGNEVGESQTITIRDAADALGGIISNARDNNRSLFLKIDCEGSEFAVLNSLRQANLLKYVDVVMIEWHKWWSANLTQHELIDPLLENGFVVFDRTTPRNIYAGMIYAVRQRSI